jgi:ketosteroid isomerase-like protein
MKVVRLAAAAFLVLSAGLSISALAQTSDKSDVMAVINAAVAAFNKGDATAWQAHCASSSPVISNIPPYQYATCSDWWSSHSAFISKNGVSNEKVTLKTAWQVDVSGDRAYAALPANYTYKEAGKKIKSSGVLTIALQKTATGWLMTGWTWSGR